jgi:hypothetical protein
MDPQDIAPQQQLAAQQTALQQPQADLQVLRQAQQPAADPFALIPAQARQDAIDLSSSSGIELRKQIIVPLKTHFDGASNELSTFLASVSDRANACNWTQSLLQISDQGEPHRTHSLIAQHRMLSLESVHVHAATYVGQQTRQAQDAFLMYEFLRDSLTESAWTKVALRSGQFTIQGTPDGPSYSKTILMTLYIENKDTGFLLHEQVHCLPDKIIELQSNIPDFNEYVHKMLVDPTSGGEESNDDPSVYLFNSHQIVENHALKSWNTRQREDYDAGRELPTVDVLMTHTDTKYHQPKLRGKWQAKSPTEEQIAAFTIAAGEHSPHIFNSNLHPLAIDNCAYAALTPASSAFTESDNKMKIRVSRRDGKTLWSFALATVAVPPGDADDDDDSQASN